MKLTPLQKQILNGEKGDGIKMALDILYQLGMLYGAKRFIPISRAHIDGCAYSTVWDAGIEFVEKLHIGGASVVVPTTLNITARDILNWRTLKIPEDFSDKSERLEQAYLNLGCTPTWSCAPYFEESLPGPGENIAWSESNAVNYVNSVIGARTNRYADLVDICCAVTGLAPEYGLHLVENRGGQILLSVKDIDKELLSDASAFATLGYITGIVSKDKIPVIEGLPHDANVEQLKAFSAASAASGSVALFHAVGITPEAATTDIAFRGKEPEDVFYITPEVYNNYRKMLSNSTNKKAGLVLIGCPHASYSEIEEILYLMKGRKVCTGVEFWIQTSRAIKKRAEDSGLLASIESLGIRVIQDSCINNFPVDDWNFASVVTNSGKMAHYAPGTTGSGSHFRSLAVCVEAAISGEVGEEW